MNRLISILIFLFLLIGNAYAVTPLADYVYYKLIFIDTGTNGSNVTTDSTDFPVLVHIDSNSWTDSGQRSLFFATGNTDGKRTNFYALSALGTPLAYNPDKYDSGNSIADYWVKVTVKGKSATDTGTAESGTANTITDDGKSWTTNAWANFAVKIISGTGAGQVRHILSNTSTALTVARNWETNPSSDSVYQIGTGLYIGYSGSGTWPSTDQSGNPWDANYLLVQHLGNNRWLGSAPEADDATSNNRDFTNYSSTDVTGKVGNGREIDSASSQYLLGPNQPSQTHLSISAWVNPSSTGISNIIFSSARAILSTQTYNWTLYINTSNYIAWSGGKTFWGWDDMSSGTSALSSGTWYHVGMSYNHTTRGYGLYKDGASIATGTKATSLNYSTSYPMYIGRFYTPSYSDQYGDAKIDEIRVSDVVRSTDWFKNEYYSMKATTWPGDGWITFGDQVNQTVGLESETLSVTRSDTILSDTYYNAFPFMARLSTGYYILVYRKATSHVGSKGIIAGRISTNTDGTAWGDEFTVYSHSTLDVRDPGVAVLSDGTVIVSANTYNGDAIKANNYCFVVRSTDNGSTWGSAISLGDGFTAGSACVTRAYEKTNGDLIQLYHGGDSGDTYASVRYIKSTNKGITWSGEVIVAESATRVYVEPQMLITPDGTWVVLMRSDINGGLYSYQIYKTFSTDDGATFTTPAIAFAGNGAPRLLKTSLGPIVIAYRGAPGSANANKVCFRFSYDNGKTFSDEKVHDLCTQEYATIVELNPSKIKMVYGIDCGNDHSDIKFADINLTGFAPMLYFIPY